MSSEESLPNTPDVESLPNTRDFLIWLNQKWSRKITAAIGLVFVFIGIRPQTVSQLAEPLFAKNAQPLLPAASIPSLLEFLVLLVLAIACAMLKPPQQLLNEKERDEAAIESCKQFMRTLVALTLSWALFYLCIFLWTLLDQDMLKPVIDGLNNLQGVFLFVCYWILTSKTAALHPTPAASSTQAASSKRPLVLWQGPLPLGALFLFLLWGLFVFLVLDFGLSGPSWVGAPARQWLQLLSGLWVGAALALVVGCMESPYLAQRIITIPLYFYAALQVAYVEFFTCHPSWTLCQSSALQTFATLGSLPLKLLFIGLWAWAFDNGLLEFYMRNTRTDIDQALRSWKKFIAGRRKSVPSPLHDRRTPGRGEPRFESP